MKPTSVILSLPFGLWGSLGCNLLEAEVASIDPTAAFVNPNINPATLDIEDNPTYASAVAEFVREVAYLQGYAQGQRIWYWDVPGDTPTFIAPMYRLIDANDVLVGPPIIDAIPTDPGYTPWWRMFLVRTTDAYNGERIWSRAAIDAAVELGLVGPPEPTTTVLDCPVVHRDTRVSVGADQVVAPTPVWYRNQRVHWLRFSSSLELPVETNGERVRQMPRFPIYIFQRINEALPLYEAKTGVDLNGDARLNASNNVFSGLPGDDRFSPLWWVSEVRTSPGFQSIDTPPTIETDLNAESQFFDPTTQRVTSPSVVSVTPRRDELINCPLQMAEGRL